MVEYAIVSGQNFLNLIKPSLIPVKAFYAKVGLNLSTGEACFVSFVLVAVIIVSLFFLLTK